MSEEPNLVRMIRNDRRFLEVWDIAAALLLALVASLAVAIYPAGSNVRLLLTAPMILFAPGYLLMQAMLVPKRPGPTRLLHAILSVGVSLAVVGLVALSTAIVRGGFKPTVIVVMMTLTCIGLAALAGYRRLYHDAPRSHPARSPRARIPRFLRMRSEAPSSAPSTEREAVPASVPAPLAASTADDLPPLVTASEAPDLPVITATEAPSPAEEQPLGRVTSRAVANQQESH